MADRKAFAEVKVTGWVENNDLQTKVKAIRRLLPKEDMVKISIYHKKGQSLDKAVCVTDFAVCRVLFTSVTYLFFLSDVCTMHRNNARYWTKS